MAETVAVLRVGH